MPRLTPSGRSHVTFKIPFAPSRAAFTLSWSVASSGVGAGSKVFMLHDVAVTDRTTR